MTRCHTLDPCTPIGYIFPVRTATRRVICEVARTVGTVLFAACSIVWVVGVAALVYYLSTEASR